MMLGVALEIFRLISLGLGPWRIEGTQRTLEFAAPKGTAGKHIRLSLERAARVRLNGIELGSGPAREFDLTELSTNGNRLSTDADAGTAHLLVTPRVFASAIQRTRRGASVTIRNTLENTANIAVTISRPGTGSGPSAVATVGPGTWHAIDLEGPVPEGKVEVLVQKEEEAVEGQYQFVAVFDMIFGTGEMR